MKLIAQVKLVPTEEQNTSLLSTMERVNAAANFISDIAWETCEFGQYDLHHLCYATIREQFGLSAQLTVRVIAKVADAYKVDSKTKRAFKPHGAIAYDERILSWKLTDKTLSIGTISGRQRIPFQAGEQQLALLQTRSGQADLVLQDGIFYLYQTCEIEEPPTDYPNGYLGVDFGIVNIATTSDGTVFAGNHLNSLRNRYAKFRARVQSKGTKSAKRLLVKRKRKESRFAKQTNHTIAKKIVAVAKDSGRGIALENLKGIRLRTTVRKSNRRQHNSWAFFDLRAKIEYKALRAGVLCVAVDPRNTSRTCPACGNIDKANRPSQSVFRCTVCDFSGHADIVAAGIIAGRAAIDRPYISA